MRHLFLTATLLVSLTACMTSRPALDVAREDTQRGAFGSVYMPDGRQYAGELLAFDDSTIVMLTSDRIAIGALARIDRLSFDDFETMYTGLHRRPSSRTLRLGRQVSRFPYGITAQTMATLLANAKQTSPDRLELIAPPHASPDAATFVAEARDANRRYQSQREAINDGFTRVGVEFPAMGEHWVSFARVMEDSLAANRPSVLIYTNVAGQPRLAGVAYTKLLTGGDKPPEFPFNGAWHEHSGAVNEESLPLGHGTHGQAQKGVVPSAARDLLSPRLFILHAWLFTPNPDGIFATDNWSLPLTRLGLPNASTERDVIRAIALAQDSDEYHRMVLRSMLKLSDRDDSAVAQVVDLQRLRAEEEVAAIRVSQQFAAETNARLSNTWSTMWLELERALPTRVAELRHLRAAM